MQVGPSGGTRITRNTPNFGYSIISPEWAMVKQRQALSQGCHPHNERPALMVRKKSV